MIAICYMAYFPPGVMPVREHLDNGARLNPHGFGFAMGYLGMHYMDADEAVTEFMAHREQFSDIPALFHARNATGDSPVTPDNIHPFQVNMATDWGYLFVAHNGYLFRHEEGRSDSRIFAYEILQRYNLDDPGSRALLEQRMGPNKAVIIHPDGAYILNAHLGISSPDGTWHSNTDYLGISHLRDGQCPQCHAETDLKPVCEPCEERAQRRRSLLMGAA